MFKTPSKLLVLLKEDGQGLTCIVLKIFEGEGFGKSLSIYFKLSSLWEIPGKLGNDFICYLSLAKFTF